MGGGDSLMVVKIALLGASVWSCPKDMLMMAEFLGLPAKSLATDTKAPTMDSRNRNSGRRLDLYCTMTTSAFLATPTVLPTR